MRFEIPKICRRFIVTICVLALVIIAQQTAFAEQEQASNNIVRYAYTPLILENDSYVSVVTPANQSRTNQRLGGLLAKIHGQFASLVAEPIKLSVGVKLLPQKNFFEETKAPRWTNAMFYRNEILVPISDFSNLDWAKLTKTIKHEYTHAVTYALAQGQCPAWIDEGLAQIIERSGNSVLNSSFKTWLEHKDPIPLKDLNLGFTKLSIEAVGPAYAQSKIAVNLLLGREPGSQGLFKLIRLTKLISAEQAFELVYGQKLADFEQELRSKLKNSDARQALFRSRNNTLIF